MGDPLKRPATEETLKIFWRGEERFGVTAYGYWRINDDVGADFPETAWPQGTETKTTMLRGVGWRVLVWDIAVTRWPERARWELALRETLEALVAAGARVAWCGLEGRFADPPSLFLPEEMSGGVYAVLTAGGEFVCTALLGAAFAALPDEELSRLRAVL